MDFQTVRGFVNPSVEMSATRAARRPGGQPQIGLEPGREIGELAGHLLGHGARRGDRLRGLTPLASTRPNASGHAIIQNLRPSHYELTADVRKRDPYRVVLNSVSASASPDGDGDAPPNARQLISSDTRNGRADAPQRHARDVMRQRPARRFSSVFIGRLDGLGERPVGETLVSGQGDHERVGILVRKQLMILDDHRRT